MEAGQKLPNGGFENWRVEAIFYPRRLIVLNGHYGYCGLGVCERLMIYYLTTVTV
jgi:hypothetical protein